MTVVWQGEACVLKFVLLENGLPKDGAAVSAAVYAMSGAALLAMTQMAQGGVAGGYSLSWPHAMKNGDTAYAVYFVDGNPVADERLVCRNGDTTDGNII